MLLLAYDPLRPRDAAPEPEPAGPEPDGPERQEPLDPEPEAPALPTTPEPAPEPLPPAEDDEPTPASPGVEPAFGVPRLDAASPEAETEPPWAEASREAEVSGGAEATATTRLAPPPAQPAAPPTQRSPLQRVLIAALLIAAAALIGYALTRPGNGEAGADALTRTAEVAARLPAPFETDDPASALAYVRGEFGWRVGVPVFPEATLEGVSIARLAPAVEVPVFVYRTDDGDRFPVFAYSYALFDQVADRLQLRRAEYDALAGEDAFVRRTRGTNLVLWRDRDDIYVAVTDLPPGALMDGLRMAR